MKLANRKGSYAKRLFWIFLVVWTLLAIQPVYRFDWLLENLLVFAVAPYLIWLHRKAALSNTAYTLIFVFLIVHAIGAHYTYSEVPFSASISKWLGWQRNHYDRAVHFLFGLVLTRPVFELLKFQSSTARAMKYFVAFCIVLTAGTVYELIEWVTALIVAPDAGNAFLGTQGDNWDAQKDLALKLAGSAIAITVMSVRPKSRLQFFAFCSLIGSSFLFGSASAETAWNSTAYFKSLTQGQELSNGDASVPFFQYARLHSRTQDGALNINGDLRYADNFAEADDRFDLYGLSLRWQPQQQNVLLELGRFSLVDGLDFLVVDGAHFRMTPQKHWNFDLFAGLQNSLEVTDATLYSKMVGGKATVYLPAGFSSEMALRFDSPDDEADDELHWRLSAGYDRMMPRPYSLRIGSEYATFAESISHLYCTQQLQLSPALSLGLIGQYRDPLISGTKQIDPIYSLFAVSGLYQLRSSVTWQWLRGWQLTPAFEINYYDTAENKSQLGEKIEVAVHRTAKALGVSGSLRYAFWHTEDDLAHIAAIEMQYALTSRFRLRGGGEIDFYDKQTHESALASFAFIEGRISLNKSVDCTLQMNGRSNEFNERDLRALVALEIKFGGTT